MKRWIAQLLVMVIVLGGVLASPAVMAWFMQSQTQVDDCTLCQEQSATQHQPASGTVSCAATACAMFANMNSVGLQLFNPLPPTHWSSPSAHHGRLLEGPDPFPPRHSRA